MRKLNCLVVGLAVLVLFGCVTIPEKTINDKLFSYPETIEIDESNLIRISYITADHLIRNLKSKMTPDQAVLVASFVDVQYLENTSNFGRLMAEYITSRLSQLGYAVSELKLRDSLYIKKAAGEFLLSREITSITTAHNAQAVVVGTYSFTGREIYVSARIVEAGTGSIISSFDYRLPATPELKKLFLTS